MTDRGPRRDADVVERIEAVRSTIEKCAGEGDRFGRLPGDVVQALRAHRLYSMAVPAELGGLELEPHTAIAAVETLTRMDSAVGWNVNQACAGAMFASRLDEAGVGLLFGGRAEWQTNDIAVWDDIAMQHYALADYESYRVNQRVPFGLYP